MKYKLVLVSVYSNGYTRSRFMYLPMDPDGRVRAPRSIIAHVPPGTTFCIG